MPIFNENSTHPIVHIKGKADWDLVYSNCLGFLADADFIKLSEYLDTDVKTVIIEHDYIDKDYRDTYYNFYSKKFANYPSRTIRLHFFKEEVPSDDIFKLDQYNDQYVGFSIIRPTRISTMGRTILNPEKLSQISGFICTTLFNVHILGAELKINGFPYISQDTDVTVCAHAACWMVFRYFSERYPKYAEVLPYEVTQLTQDVSYGRLIPSKGLTVFQVTEMFSKFGFYPEIYIRESDKENFHKLLYYYIESGLPVVAGLSKDKHAITIIGHTKGWGKEISPGDSYNFIDGFIINDDNYLPYQKLLKKEAERNGYCSNFNLEDVDSFIVPLYEKIYFSAEYVESLSEAVLSDRIFGVNALSEHIRKNEIVKRLYLTSSKSYKMERRMKNMPFEISCLYCGLQMPKFIWVCEISTPELYSKREVVGEIIFDATANHCDRFSFLAIHYPDFMVINDRDYLLDDPNRFLTGTGRLRIESIQSYPMYMNNLKEV